MANETEKREYIAAVRKRPGMYIGSTDTRGLHHMIMEVAGNSLDQVLGGRAHSVRVDVDRDDWVTVEDDGSGISVDPLAGSTFLETIFTTLSMQPTVDGHHPHVHLTPAQLGRGMGAVSAVSARIEVESRIGGAAWRAAFERGVCVEPLHSIGATSASGTTVRFLPDAEIFPGVRIDRVHLKQRMLELARLVPTLRVQHQGEVLSMPEGLAGWVREEAPDVIDVISGSGMLNDVQVEFALGWSPSVHETRHRSFVNLCSTHNGTHDRAFEAALKVSAGGTTLWRAVKNGVVSVLHVKMLHPRFGDPTHTRLDSEEAREPVIAAISKTAPSSFWEAIRTGRPSRG
jgi:DNA gyrase/topoisomerase IV subunit B